MTDEIHIAVIGGGVVGCATAWELSKAFKGIYLFEKNPGITRGENQSSRNSGVIHSGIYYDEETRPQKAALCVEGNRLLYEFCSRYRVPALRSEKLVVATKPDEEAVLGHYLDRARLNRVPGVEMISGEKVAVLEPNVSAISALRVPSAGIIEPTTLVYRLHTLASDQGVHFLTGTRVIQLFTDGSGIRIRFAYQDGKEDEIYAQVVVNAAGTEADRLAKLVQPASPYELDPVIGESYKFYSHKRQALRLAGMNIYPTPELVKTTHGRHFTVGIHLTPTLENRAFPPEVGTTVTVGPKLHPVDSRDVPFEPHSPARLFAEKVRAFFPDLRDKDLIWHQLGLQARLKGYPDFVFASDPAHPNFISLLGMDSPGLTSSLAIARRASAIVKNLLG